MPDITLRAATAADQPAIQRIIRAEGLNPMALDWPRFIVAELDGDVVGIGQIKVLGDGARELASLAVLPAHQGTGVGGALVWTLISRTPGPLYLRCASHNEGYYHRFGFMTLTPEQMPPSLRRMYRIVNPLVGVYNWVTGGCERMLIMGRL